MDPKTTPSSASESLPLQIANGSSETECFVKSVRIDTNDVTPYYCYSDKVNITRMDYVEPELLRDNKLHLPLPLKRHNIPARITKMELLDMPLANYTLSIHGCNVGCLNNSLDFTSQRNSVLKTFIDISKERLSAKGPCLTDVDFIHDCFDTMTIYHPKNIELPKEVKMKFSGYDANDSVLYHKCITLYPYDTYRLNLKYTTDHLIILYRKKQTVPAQEAQEAPASITFMDNYRFDCPDQQGSVCVKLQDPHYTTGLLVNMCYPGDHINFSRYNYPIRLVGHGVEILKVVQCYYMSYHIPTPDTIMAPNNSSSYYKNALYANHI